MTSPEQMARIERAFRQENALLVRWLTKKLGDADDARDVAQNVYLRVWAFAEKTDVEHPRALIFKTAANLAFNEMKRRNRHGRRHVAAASNDEEDPVANIPCPAPTPEEDAAIRADVADVLSTIEGLPSKTRRAFSMSRFDGLTYREIAQELGVSESSVEKYVIEALKVLRRRMRRRGEAEVVPFPGGGRRNRAANATVAGK